MPTSFLCLQSLAIYGFSPSRAYLRVLNTSLFIIVDQVEDGIKCFDPGHFNLLQPGDRTILLAENFLLANLGQKDYWSETNVVAKADILLLP